MYQVYEIMDGDTFDSVALRMGITCDELERINGFNSFDIGDMIVVPKSDEMYYKYVVKPGDNLYSIAKMYNQDTDVIYTLNGIKKDDYIYPGEELLIPRNNVFTYITRDGDTLEGISNMTSISVDDILENNRNLVLESGQLIMYERD